MYVLTSRLNGLEDMDLDGIQINGNILSKYIKAAANKFINYHNLSLNEVKSEIIANHYEYLSQLIFTSYATQITAADNENKLTPFASLRIHDSCRQKALQLYSKYIIKVTETSRKYKKLLQKDFKEAEAVLKKTAEEECKQQCEQVLQRLDNTSIEMNGPSSSSSSAGATSSSTSFVLNYFISFKNKLDRIVNQYYKKLSNYSDIDILGQICDKVLTSYLLKKEFEFLHMSEKWLAAFEQKSNAAIRAWERLSKQGEKSRVREYLYFDMISAIIEIAIICIIAFLPFS